RETCRSAGRVRAADAALAPTLLEEAREDRGSAVVGLVRPGGPVRVPEAGQVDRDRGPPTRSRPENLAKALRRSDQAVHEDDRHVSRPRDLARAPPDLADLRVALPGGGRGNRGRALEEPPRPDQEAEEHETPRNEARELPQRSPSTR